MNVILNSQLTLLNCFRLQENTPKHSKEQGFCTPIKIVGNIFCISIGNKCQSNCLNLDGISANLSVIRCPNSQIENIENNTPNPRQIEFHSITGSNVSFDYELQE